jgi:hypothetical protein
VQHVIALSRSALVIRHWFEIDLEDASMEHGARVELRELAEVPRRGSESAAQVITADRPVWRADLFDRLADQPGTFGVAHYHPEFHGNEPCDRVWSDELTADPWRWLHEQVASVGAASVGAAAGGKAWPLGAEDAEELAGLATTVVELAQRFAPVRCSSAAQCFSLTRDARDSVRLMMEYLRRPELLDRERTALWR